MESSLGPCDSQGSLHSIAAAKSTCRGKGTGNHISALRSLGLLHELQEYVAACVETQQQQEKELGRLKAEKREVERVLKKEQRAPEKQPYVQHFQASEIADLPPRLRGLFEDNKVLKELNRRYKQRAQDAERHADKVEQQLLTAQAANSKLKAQLLEGHSGTEAAETEATRHQVEALTKALEKLQHAHGVLQQKQETDGRLHRQAIAAAGRDRQQLEQQVEQLQQQLDCKDKDVRAQALAAKQAQRKLEEVKASAAKAVASVNARVAEAVAAVEAHNKQAEHARVHLMLCIIRDPAEDAARHRRRQHQRPSQQQQIQQGTPGDIWAEGNVTAGSIHSAHAADASSSYLGDMTREEAVLKLQAGTRGFLARKHLRLLQQQEEQSFVLVQAGGVTLQQQQQPQQQQPGDIQPGSMASLATSSSMHASAAEPGALPGFGSSLALELPVLQPAGPDGYADGTEAAATAEAAAGPGAAAVGAAESAGAGVGVSGVDAGANIPGAARRRHSTIGGGTQAKKPAAPSRAGLTSAPSPRAQRGANSTVYKTSSTAKAAADAAAAAGGAAAGPGEYCRPPAGGSSMSKSSSGKRHGSMAGDGVLQGPSGPTPKGQRQQSQQARQRQQTVKSSQAANSRGQQ